MFLHNIRPFELFVSGCNNWGWGSKALRGISLTDQKESNYRLLWMLGLALTLPMILLGGPLAGYILGEFLLVKKLGMPPYTTPVLMGLGLMGAALQVYRLIQRLRQSNSTK